MPLVSLKLRPGLFRNGTRYQAKGRWHEGQLVRFLEGAIRPVGGWEELNLTSGSPVTFDGVPRALLGWQFGTSPTLAIGTNTKLYTFIAGALTDRTPAGLTAGAVDSALVTGQFGAGPFGAGPFGEGDTSQGALVEAASWQFDTFGDFLVAVLTGDGELYHWDTAASLAVKPTASTGTVPVSNVGVVVTAERFVVCLGAGGDARTLQWADQESLTAWDPTVAGSAAGDFILPGQGALMTGARGKNETLIWTDQDLFSMRFIGGTLVYAVPQVGAKCGIISRHAKAVIDGRAIWMGQRGFFVYDGAVRPLQSDVADFVFTDFNRTQRAKCFAWPQPQFGEVWFFYPSGSSQEIDRYVIYNYLEDHWNAGTLTRTAGIDRGAFDFPSMGDTTRIYDHERGSAKAGAATPFLESGPVEIGDGEQVADVVQSVPDESTLAGQVLGSLEMRVFSSLTPSGTETESGPFTLSEYTDLRISARQLRVRYTEIVEGEWRLGTPRFDIRPGSRR